MKIGLTQSPDAITREENHFLLRKRVSIVTFVFLFLGYIFFTVRVATTVLIISLIAQSRALIQVYAASAKQLFNNVTLRIYIRGVEATVK